MLVSHDILNKEEKLTHFDAEDLNKTLTQGAYQLFWNLRPVCTTNDEHVLENRALAATQEIR